MQKLSQWLRTGLKWLEGKKTYALVVLGILTVLAGRNGLIDADTTKQLLEVLGFGTAAAVRQAIARLLTAPAQQ